MEELSFFGKWSPANVEIRDEGLRKYINLDPRLVPHTHGRHEHKRFRKANVSILERFINRLLVPGLRFGATCRHPDGLAQILAD